MMELYLVRHTTPDIAHGVCYGQSDIEVAPSFQEELAILRPKLAHLEHVTVYSSPLKRCLQLAHAVVGEDRIAAVKEDVRLKELHFGDWELQAWNDIPRGLVDVWAEEHVMNAPPNGESFHALYLRAKSFVEDLAAEATGPYLAFTHAGVIRAITGYALGLPLINTFRLQIGYASVTQVIIENDIPRIGYVNR